MRSYGSRLAIAFLLLPRRLFPRLLRFLSASARACAITVFSDMRGATSLVLHPSLLFLLLLVLIRLSFSAGFVRAGLD